MTREHQVDLARQPDFASHSVRLGKGGIAGGHQLGRVGFDLDGRERHPPPQANDHDRDGCRRWQRANRGKAAARGSAHPAATHHLGKSLAYQQ